MCRDNRDDEPVGMMNPPLFIIGIFRKSASKYAKLMIELYVCDNLIQIY